MLLSRIPTVRGELGREASGLRLSPQSFFVERTVKRVYSEPDIEMPVSPEILNRRDEQEDDAGIMRLADLILSRAETVRIWLSHPGE